MTAFTISTGTDEYFDAKTGGSSANVLSGRAIAMAHESTGAGGARSAVGSAMAVSGHGYAIARGGKNLPDAVLAAVVRATIDTRR